VNDPWTAFLDWLETVMVPDWTALIGLLPVFIVLGVLGPGLSLLVLYHLYHRFTRRKGRVRLAEIDARPAERDEAGEPIFPPNVPFCPTHALVHPPQDRSCAVDGEELSVLCPIDRAPRPASQQTCRTCGTKYVLGASNVALTVRRSGRPPEGGAAVA
jgi:hypothetical protein